MEEVGGQLSSGKLAASLNPGSQSVNARPLSGVPTGDQLRPQRSQSEQHRFRCPVQHLTRFAPPTSPRSWTMSTNFALRSLYNEIPTLDNM